MNEIIRDGDFIVRYGYLNSEDFKLSPIWCEYYDPIELEDLEEGGVSKEKLETNLLGSLDRHNSNPYYTLLGKNTYLNREFLCVKCSVKVGDFILEGFVKVVSGDVNSITIFADEDIDLYKSDILTDDNNEALQKIEELFEIDILNTDHFHYILQCDEKCGLEIESDFYFSQ